jgi:3',5'-cyclic AMP phosphodiesterase CpdA
VADIEDRSTGSGGTFDFHLWPTAGPDGCDVLVITDPQPANLREVDYLKRALVLPYGNNLPSLSFGLVLGDVTYDRPDLYPDINRALQQVGIPWFVVNGNHDLALGVGGEEAVRMFESTFGPSTYAFYGGPALFIALNDVRHEGGPRYHGGLLPEQREFLTQLLEKTRATTPVVVFCHIPWFQADPFAAPVFPLADRNFLFELLARFRTVMVLSGHTHTQRKVVYQRSDGWTGAAPLLEENVAAFCGGYWGGPTDRSEIPISTMSDGTPPGYAILHVRADDLSIEYHTRPDLEWTAASKSGMTLHVPMAVAPGAGFVSYYANVFDGGPGTLVNARIDQRDWVPMKRSIAWDPTYSTAFLAQDSAPIPSKTPRLPDPSLCFHLWRGILPADLAVGPHTLTVQAGAKVATARFAVRTAN